MKYALSVKQSLLFTDLSLIGCAKKYFKKVLDIDYSFPECLIRGDDLFWNYDNDISYDKAILNNGTLNKAVKHFNTSLAKATKNLEEVTNKILKSEKWSNENKAGLKVTFEKYIQAYLLNMPFLFHFWNIENLLINQLKGDFTSIFGKDDGENILQQVLIPSKETYFTKERKSIEELALYILKTPKLKSVFQKESNQVLLNKIDKFPKLESMIKQHINLFAFTSFVLHLGNPQDITSVLERLRELLREDI